MLDKSILAYIYPSEHTERVLKYQNRQLNSLLSDSKLERMVNAEVYTNETYSPSQMINDLRQGIFSEITRKVSVDVYRRNLQKAFIIKLGELLNSQTINSDVNAIARGELNILKYQLSTASSSLNTITKYHYKDCKATIEHLLNPKN